MWMKPSPWVWMPVRTPELLGRGLERGRVAQPLAADVDPEGGVPVVADGCRRGGRRDAASLRLSDPLASTMPTMPITTMHRDGDVEPATGALVAGPPRLRARTARGSTCSATWAMGAEVTG